MSTYINMELNQLIIQGGIPFSVKLAPKPYSDNEIINEIEATLKMEGMELEADDIKILKTIRSGKMTASDSREIILSEV